MSINCGTTKIVLQNVFLVQNLKKNLLSVSQLTKYCLSSYVIKDKKTGQMVAKGSSTDDTLFEPFQVC